MPNFFQHPVPEIRDIVADPAMVEIITSARLEALQALGLDAESAVRAGRVCDQWGVHPDVFEYEKAAHQALEQEGVGRRIPEILARRARQIYMQVSPLTGGRVLDLGCGDGGVGRLLAEGGHEVDMTDIYRHPEIGFGSNPLFRLSKPGAPIPYGANEFDTTLLATVLHHSDDPLHLIREARRVTRPGGRALVIESVYGVEGEALVAGHRERTRLFLGLSPEQQWLLNAYFDHFYNRVIHYNPDPAKKVNVPFNFNTPRGWQSLFEANGFTQSDLVCLGVDQPAVFEYHTLHHLVRNRA